LTLSILTRLLPAAGVRSTSCHCERRKATRGNLVFPLLLCSCALMFLCSGTCPPVANAGSLEISEIFCLLFATIPAIIHYIADFSPLTCTPHI
jgi:hypothetical protein